MTGLHPEGTANVVVVDLSVESQGYLYVLKYFTPASGRYWPPITGLTSTTPTAPSWPR